MNLFVRPIQSTQNQKGETTGGSLRHKTGASSFDGLIRALQREGEGAGNQQRQDAFYRSVPAEEQDITEQAAVIRPPIQTIDQHTMLMLLSQRV